MKNTTRIQLSVMMFLEFFIWGGWFVTLGTFLFENLGATGSQTAMAFSTQSWGAIIAPFIIGLIADRFKADGWQVMHLTAPGRSEPHPYTSAARIVDGELDYSAPEPPQASLF